MSLHCFAIRALDPGADQQAFNSFCAAHRVLRIERQFVADGVQSFWALCVEVADGPGALPASLKQPGRGRLGSDGGAAKGDRPDYKQLLSEADFTVFAALRSWRKAQAEVDGVPLFAVFTNDQLAEVARRRCGSLAALADIDGVGPARVERYGEAVLQCVVRAGAQAGAGSSAGEPP